MLSDYQRAVLTELGVMCWQSQHKAPTNTNVSSEQAKRTSSHDGTQGTEVDKAAIKSNALEKLSQLKQKQESVSYSGQIICLFDVAEPLPTVVLDILTAMALENMPKLQLTSEQVKQAKEYALCWLIADETLSLTANKLITPPIQTLSDVKLKKQLWRLIQQMPHAAT
jgi:DNA polymerase III psi subunit